MDSNKMQETHCRADGKGGENQDAEDNRSDAGPSGPPDADNGDAFLETSNENGADDASEVYRVRVDLAWTPVGTVSSRDTLR